jgi:hypothetical protein
MSLPKCPQKSSLGSCALCMMCPLDDASLVNQPLDNTVRWKQALKTDVSRPRLALQKQQRKSSKIQCGC